MRLSLVSAALRGSKRMAALGPMRTFVGRRGKGAGGQAYSLRWSGLRCAPTALRCSVSWPRRGTRYVHFVHCALTAAPSQWLMRAARAATSPALLGAPEARSSLPARAFAGAWAVRGRTDTGFSRQAVPAGGDFWGDEERRSEVGARSALRELTRRGCSSAVSAANVASSAARPRTEHRSAVGAQRRPPQHEPAAGTACRDARSRHEHKRPQRAECRHPRRAATHGTSI